MKTYAFNRLAAALVLGLLLAAPSFPTQAQPRHQDPVSQTEADKDKEEQADKDKKEKKEREERRNNEGRGNEGRDDRGDRRDSPPPMAATPAQPAQPAVAPRRDMPPPTRERPWQSQPGTAAPGHAQGELARQGRQDRLDDRQRQQRIAAQRAQYEAYDRVEVRREAASRNKAMQLQQQRRSEQARYQLAYEQRLRLQQQRFRGERYDYNNDPYNYTPSNFRYRRDGRYYETNQYGANALRSAVNNGYQEGFYAGRADRADRWRFDFRQTYAYQNANFGYNGRHVRQSEYNYYFRQGFERGYSDGYYSRRQYGRNSDGSDLLLDTVLRVVLNLETMR